MQAHNITIIDKLTALAAVNDRQLEYNTNSLPLIVDSWSNVMSTHRAHTRVAAHLFSGFRHSPRFLRKG